MRRLNEALTRRRIDYVGRNSLTHRLSKARQIRDGCNDAGNAGRLH
jgi:hypothetical protein